MDFGGFTCKKNSLVSLNVFYVLVSFVLIGAVGYGRIASFITTPSSVIGIMACGLILLAVAITGLVGVVKHHQAILFFYIFILSLLFLVQFAIACTCLAMSRDQQRKAVRMAWMEASVKLKTDTQDMFACCGLDQWSQDLAWNESMGHPACNSTVLLMTCCENSHAACCTGAPVTSNNTLCPCPTCWQKISPHIGHTFKTVGGIGLFFSVTEVFGVWLAARYRDIKDPSFDPTMLV